MHVITILYARTDDSTFDMDYYTSKHMPMFAEAIGDNCQGWGAAAVPDGPYAAVSWATFASLDAFNASMAEHGGKISKDIPNYTNVQPEVIIGEYAGGSS